MNPLVKCQHETNTRSSHKQISLKWNRTFPQNTDVSTIWISQGRNTETILMSEQCDEQLRDWKCKNHYLTLTSQNANSDISSYIILSLVWKCLNIIYVNNSHKQRTHCADTVFT